MDKGLSVHAIAKILDDTVPNDNKKKGRLSASTVKNRLNEWGYVYENGQWVKKSENTER